jgi:putative restriction endonuclease
LNALLWKLMQQPMAREETRQTLLTRCFPLTRHYLRPQAGQKKLAKLGHQMLKALAAVYNRAMDIADESEVLPTCQSTCAVSGLQLLSVRVRLQPPQAGSQPMTNG